ncbi:hypothetical protein [Luteimonas aquatica]|uniref:hypothetical protein n=1 Tax=Luteimonas aquatica TaxID=450364 RepID=UPI001F59931E|nr:hypothetical protein [Luteimonas aquatica]
MSASPISSLFRRLKTRLATSGLSALFAPRKPRHALLRVAFGVLGVALLLVLLVIGVFVGAAMLIGGLLLRLLGQRGKPVARKRVVDGEYRVVGKNGAAANARPPIARLST